MMSILYDNRDIYKEIVLDLPFREGTGALTHSVAKTHPEVRLVNTPTWTALASGLMVPVLNGTTEYLEADGADTTNLDFTSEDYSLGGWFQWTDSVHDSQILMGRYEVSVSGWELYLTESGSLRYLSLRQHHAAGASVRTSAYSLGWAFGTPWFFGVSRSGASAQFYRNGVAVTTVSEALIDPETCAEDLVIGVRTSKDSNYLAGYPWRLRAWPKALTGDDWKTLYELEKGWFA